MIDPIALGATLYIPATRPDLAKDLFAGRHSNLRSTVLCIEDSVQPQLDPQALLNLQALLRRLGPCDDGQSRPYLFIRPRSATMLSHILGFDGVEHVDGFVIPKATATTLPDYLAVLRHDHHQLMPTLETREVFDFSEMRRLRDQLLSIQERIVALRIGGNDLLQTIGARRSAFRTSYDGPLGTVIANLVTSFRPWGFHLSAPVFENFGNADLLAEEVARDIDHGLLTKTAIHPSQIAIIQQHYSVSSVELEEAKAILSLETAGVFASRGAMVEPATHSEWAGSILRRATHFGTNTNGHVVPLRRDQ